MPLRRLVAYSGALVAALWIAGWGIELRSPRTISLQVTGTAGTRITGEYTVTADGTISRHIVDQEIPFSIELNGHALSCVLQKLGGQGTVRMQLIVDGQTVAFDWTRDAFGSASVASP